MEQTVRAFDQQYLEKTAADLLVLKAEIQKLKGLIRAVAKRSRGVRRTTQSVEVRKRGRIANPELGL
jgi:prefoldin subunit 5